MENQIRKESISIYDNYKLDSEIKNTDEKYYFIFYERELLLIDNQVPLINDFNLVPVIALSIFLTSTALVLS